MGLFISFCTLPGLFTKSSAKLSTSKYPRPPNKSTTSAKFSDFKEVKVAPAFTVTLSLIAVFKIVFAVNCLSSVLSSYKMLIAFPPATKLFWFALYKATQSICPLFTKSSLAPAANAGLSGKFLWK